MVVCPSVPYIALVGITDANDHLLRLPGVVVSKSGVMMTDAKFVT